MKPLIINLAPTGMKPTRAQSPHVPLTIDEVAADCAYCVAMGVSILHLHARGADGTPTNDSTFYGDLVLAVRERSPQAIIVTSTSGRLVGSIDQRAANLFLGGICKPDMASLTLSSMNFNSEASINAPDTVIQLVTIMQEQGIRPELEVFDLGMVNFAKILIDKGLLTPPFYFNIILGNASSAQASLLHLGAMVADLPPQSIWAVGGIGRYQMRANALGIAVGDGVRTGLEDNLWMDDARTTLATNKKLVERIVAQAVALGRPLASPALVRSWLGMEHKT